MPLVLFSAHPNIPDTVKHFLLPDLHSLKSTHQSSGSQPPSTIAIAILNALTLLLGVPALIITTPSLPIPERIRHATMFPLSKVALSILYIALALVPAWASSLLSDILLVLALASTYFLPGIYISLSDCLSQADCVLALIHVTAHFFKRPLSIVMPQIPGTPLPGHSRQGSAPGSPRADELLLRKERALQKKQFRRRIIWDIGVWALLLGSVAGGVLAVGRVMGRW